jgi:hypothetical protein
MGAFHRLHPLAVVASTLAFAYANPAWIPGNANEILNLEDALYWDRLLEGVASTVTSDAPTPAPIDPPSATLSPTEPVTQAPTSFSLSPTQPPTPAPSAQSASPSAQSPSPSAQSPSPSAQSPSPSVQSPSPSVQSPSPTLLGALESEMPSPTPTFGICAIDVRSRLVSSLYSLRKHVANLTNCKNSFGPHTYRLQ